MPEIGLPELTAAQWSLVFVSAFGLGVAKSGFAGIGLFHVVVFAFIFGAKKSTGYVLPMLIFGDVCAVAAWRGFGNMLGGSTSGACRCQLRWELSSAGR